MYLPYDDVTERIRNVESDRDITFCGHTILSNEPMVVLNAEKDWRLAQNPLVTGWPYVRFYAGAPVFSLCNLAHLDHHVTRIRHWYSLYYRYGTTRLI